MQERHSSAPGRALEQPTICFMFLACMQRHGSRARRWCRTCYGDSHWCYMHLLPVLKAPDSVGMLLAAAWQRDKERNESLQRQFAEETAWQH